MKRLLTVGAMVALALVCAGCSGCTSTIQAAAGAATSGKGVLSGQKIDEQAMGGVYALASSANLLIAAAANSGLASRDQLLAAKQIGHDIDAGVLVARAAYDAGDAASFNAKVAALAGLNTKAQAFYNEVKPK
jgi:hypothetical protein